MAFLNRFSGTLLWLAFIVCLTACTVRYDYVWLSPGLWAVALLLACLLARRHYKMRSQPVMAATTLDETRDSAIFLLGPWARTWFSGALEGEAIRLVKGRVWFFAATPQALTRHLETLKSRHPDVIPLSFFPLIPDAHASADLLRSQITMWQNTFASLSLADPLPCTFALYTRMSGERHAQDPDAAIWSGAFPAANAAQRDFSAAFDDALAALKNCQFEHHHALRREAMASVLRHWLQETRLAPALETLFSTLPLKLNGVIFADYGTGFVRHGAWSGWCEQTFGVLPALSASCLSPPLPEPQSRYRVTTVSHTTPAGSTAGFKAILATLLTMAVTLVLITGHEAWWAHQIHQQMRSLASVDEYSGEARKLRLEKLENTRRQLEACSRNPVIWPVGAGHCKRLNAEADLHIHPEKVLRPAAALEVLAGFASSSAALTPEHEQRLRTLLPELVSSNASHFLIAGYSDITGSEEHNQILSEQRAQAVKDWLIAHTTIPALHFVIYGGGAQQPSDDNQREAARAKNRRVEIYALHNPDNKESSYHGK